MLRELGFKKSAGAQADIYRTVKPQLLESLNIRNTADFLQAHNSGGRVGAQLFKKPETITELLKWTVLQDAAKGSPRTANKTKNQIANRLALIANSR